MTDTVVNNADFSVMETSGVISISGELTIYQVTEVNPLLQAALDRARLDKTPPRIDLSEMTECDGAGLQMLIALARATNAVETKVILEHVPIEIAAMLKTYNVSEFFNLGTGG